MAEYINRAEAIAIMHKLHDDDVARYSVDIPECFDAKTAIEALKTIPASDVVEVKHGKWIAEKLSDMKCSLCREIYPVCGGLCGDYNYCPNCGAKMDGGAL